MLGASRQALERDLKPWENQPSPDLSFFKIVGEGPLLNLDVWEGSEASRLSLSVSVLFLVGLSLEPVALNSSDGVHRTGRNRRSGGLELPVHPARGKAAD